jgi:hypothetical protein
MPKVDIHQSLLSKQHFAPLPKNYYLDNVLTQVLKRSLKRCLDLVNHTPGSRTFYFNDRFWIFVEIMFSNDVELVSWSI